jgi:hypothetical protein
MMNGKCTGDVGLSPYTKKRHAQPLARELLLPPIPFWPARVAPPRA